MEPMSNVIQVGTGRWGGNWASEILPTVDTINVTAHVDANPAALAALQDKLGVPAAKCFTSLTAALAAVPCDIVLGTLRTEAHFPVMMEALEAGKHAIVEKPFASTIAEARQLVAAAEARGLHMIVSQNYRFYRAPRAVAAALEAGMFGPLDSVAVDFRRHGPSMGYLYYEFPDPLIADMSIHHFDLMRMVLGSEAVRVACRTWNPPGSPFQHDPSGHVLIEFANGVMLSYRGSWMAGGADTPWSGTWAMNCTEGEIRWACRGDAGSDRSAVDWAFGQRRGEPERPLIADAPLRHHDRAGTIAALAEAIATGRIDPHMPTGADNIGSLALVKAATLSAARRGAWVETAEILAA
jgi:predicted dehydrogenase